MRIIKILDTSTPVDNNNNDVEKVKSFPAYATEDTRVRVIYAGAIECTLKPSQLLGQSIKSSISLSQCAIRSLSYIFSILCPLLGLLTIYLKFFHLKLF